MVITRRSDNDRRRQRLSIDYPAAREIPDSTKDCPPGSFGSRSLIVVVSSFGTMSNNDGTVRGGNSSPRSPNSKERIREVLHSEGRSSPSSSGAV